MNSKRTILLVGLFLAMFFASLDQTVVGTAMPRIIGELNGLDIFAWVTIAYLLTSTAIVPIAGKLADLFGRRVVYISGIAVFMAGSALCGTSQDMTQLIIWRAVQGLGGGMMMPLAMVIVGDIFPPEKRGAWQGIIGAVFGLSSIIGPTLGGWIVDNSTWHWIFYINLPFGLLAGITMFIGLSGEVKRTTKPIIDWAGAFTLVTGVVCLLLGLNLSGKDFDWGSWQSWSLFGSSVALLVAFVFIELASKEPILDVRFFKIRLFTVTNLVGFLMGFGMFGSIMFLPLYLQGVVGISATNSGNMMLPMLAGLILTSVLAGRFITKVRFRDITLAALLVMCAAFALLSTMTTTTPVWEAIVYIVILGLGMGLIMPTVTVAVQSAFPAEQRGVATSSTQFFRSIGATLGVTILGVVLNHQATHLLHNEFVPQMQKVAQLAGTTFQAYFDKMLGEVDTNPLGLFNQLLNPALLAKMPQALQDQILPPLKEALAQSLSTVFFSALLLTASGLIVALFFGNSRVTGEAPKATLEEVGRELMVESPMAAGGEIPGDCEPDLVGTNTCVDPDDEVVKA